MSKLCRYNILYIYQAMKDQQRLLNKQEFRILTGIDWNRRNRLCYKTIGIICIRAMLCWPLWNLSLLLSLILQLAYVVFDHDFKFWLIKYYTMHASMQMPFKKRNSPFPPCLFLSSHCSIYIYIYRKPSYILQHTFQLSWTLRLFPYKIPRTYGSRMTKVWALIKT